MNNKFLKPIAACAALLLMAACSHDNELADGDRLPEGKYPITFTATGMQVTPVTRATVDGTWKDGDVVSVQVGNEIKKYIAEGSGENVTLKPFDANNTFYWKNTDDINVTAWSLGRRTPFNYTPTIITVPADQSNNEFDYSDNDFIYAQGTLSYNGNKSLTFYHQTAKVVVHVLSGDDTPTGMNINKLETRTLSVSANWVAPEIDKGDYGKCTTYGTAMSITPFSLGKMDIILPGNKGQATTLASYKFLIVPQDVEKSNGTLFTITADNYGAPFNYTPESDIEWLPGREYTYYITIKGSKVTATVTTSMAWATGATGSGSVTLPVVYDLSSAQPITISDNNTYLITGSGSNTITISGDSPTVILTDIELRNNISITGGSPTLIIQGTNTITYGSISLSNNANVTIKGKNADNIDENVLNITNGGIGSSTARAICGNIVIEGIKAKITNNNMGAGIGSAQEGKCGNITIQKSIIDVTSISGNAAIGSGFKNSECGNIEIINSDITASGSNFSSFYSSAIGCGGNQSSCKDITITLKEGQTKEELEAKLTASFAEKVGLGGMIGANLSGKVGTITWKSSYGMVIGTPIGARDL